MQTKISTSKTFTHVLLIPKERKKNPSLAYKRYRKNKLLMNYGTYF
jgi:hypothetical protein